MGYTPKNVIITSALQATLDSAIARGAPQREIGALLGVSENSMTEVGRKYLHSTGTHELWLSARRSRTHADQKVRAEYLYERTTVRELLIPALEALITQKAGESDFALKKAHEYYCSISPPKRRADSFERYTRFFHEYACARDKGERISLQELGKRSGFFYTHARRMLLAVGLSPLGRPKKE